MHKGFTYTLLALLVATLPKLCHAQEKIPDLKAILSKIGSRERRIASAEANFTKTTTMAQWYADSIKLPKNLGQRSVVNATWAFKGPKTFYRERATTNPHLQNQWQQADASHHRETITIYDGTNEHLIDSAIGLDGARHNYDNVVNALVHRPNHFMSPLDFGCMLNGKWISEALRDNKSAAIDGIEPNEQFDSLLVISFDTGGNTRARIWIAPNFDYAVVRSELVAKWPDTRDSYTIDRFSCSKLQLVSGSYLPVLCDFQSIRRVGAKDDLKASITLRDINYNINTVQDSVFATSAPPGSIIYNQAANTRTKVGDHGDATVDETYSTLSRELPIRWLLVATITTLLLLTTNAIVRWRPRHSQ